MPGPQPTNSDQPQQDPNEPATDHSSPNPSPPPIPDILLQRPAAPPAPKATTDRGNKQFAERLVQISVIGSNFAFSVMAAGLLGWALQTWLLKSAAPWPLVIGLALGLILGFYRFIREALKAINEDPPTKKP
jgi:F0F1-type ATP synthase assembly protein I